MQAPSLREEARQRGGPATGRFFLAFTRPFAAGCPPPAGVTRWVTIWRAFLRHNETMNVATASASRTSSARGVLPSALIVAALTTLAAAGARAADGSVTYQCPGAVFTNTITAKEAEAKGCKAMVIQQPTTIPAPKTRPATASPGGASRVDAQEQKARDSDSRKILQDELIKAQAQLDALQKEYNNGQPERQGDEKNYQKYLDRTADLKAQIARTESDISAITRELAKTQ